VRDDIDSLSPISPSRFLFGPLHWSVGFCRESRVEGIMSRVEGKMSRVEGKCRGFKNVGIFFILI